ncbi:ABC transporter periplasmic-binding protein ytfQ precursor [uncultured Clostridium sp.]|uniref:ABC transporter substrate-binding protein n=1 Tax=Muricoprocola aceti TaxID=2981772 RepID=A0ABT2SP01_9FIRM|nr:MULTISPECIES: ABC transporter substrate-binding protein [Lachnospiraceae]MDD7437022.1 ABC transporter substrate-binding protein [Lachnospiraceae bacterium]SCH83102.1 ABC transporter periplasmic-binding protein ytfQ precursor [uncultured Clostridium sp.]MCI7451308.1 ABC transporter substrate-binding protein [Blautia sp.]MCU6726242.1 ABC transporter substrate-binding protein [Muricoprocola aceti]MDY3342214.1 ABC transporter substrate-binding protein [Lachnospiraceae bacterium]
MNRQIAAGGMILGSAILLSGCQVTEERQRETAYTSAISQTETEIDENLIVVGVSQVGAESDWRIAQTNSIKESLTAENGFYMIFDNAQQKQENQIKAIRNFILQEVDYIVLDPIVMSGWDNVLQNAKEAEIPVILVDRDVEVDDDSLYVTSVVTDMVAEGRNAGYWLEDYLEKQGREDEDIQIVMLLGTEGASAQIGRTKGFTEIAGQHENWKILEQLDGDFTQAKGRESMETLLKKYDDIDVVISENDNMTFGAIDAIQDAGRSCGPGGDMIMISFDAVRAALEAMQAGEINADFECNPLQGPKLAETIKRLENGEEVEKVQYIEETYFDTTMDLETLIRGRAY